MVEIDTLFQTKTAKKNIPFGAAHAYTAYIRDDPPGRKMRCRLWVSLLTQARLINLSISKLPYLFENKLSDAIILSNGSEIDLVLYANIPSTSKRNAVVVYKIVGVRV